MWHHLTYMVVSIALLGFGAAGSILTVRQPGPTARPPHRLLTVFAVLYGLSVYASFLVATRLPPDAIEVWRSAEGFVRLALLYAVISVPFLMGGFVVGLALTRLVDRVQRLYFFDLAGSALGGASSVWLLSRFGSSATVAFAGTLGLLAGSVFAAGEGRRSLAATLPALAGGAVACIAFAGGWGALGIPPLEWPIPFAPGKEFAGLPAAVEVTRFPSATAEVEVTSSARVIPITGGDFGHRDRRGVFGRYVGQDGSAPTMLYENAANLSAFPFLDDSQTASPFICHRASGGERARVLVIGVGGGVDVMIALAHDASQVTAVEINRAMIDLVEREFDSYLGGLFRPGAHRFSDRVELVHGEGRSYARSGGARFDVIQMAGVDSFTALNTGAYTLSESHLYTTEAVQDFYSRLTDGGYLHYSRFFMGHPKKARETLRLTNIARAALAELGVPDPASQIAVFRGERWASTLIKRGAFTRSEMEALDAFAQREGFWGLVFDPVRGSEAPIGRSGETPDAVAHFERTRSDFELLVRGNEEQRRRFVDGYEFDLEPSTDDLPFFFNYYRYGSLLRGRPSGDVSSDPYASDFPMGHGVLLASLFQIASLGAILLLLPLARLSRTGSRSPLGRGPVFAYFASLGVGFMFVEISLMQKTILFLGHPIHAVTVVLTTLLASAGIGSLISGRSFGHSARGLRRLMTAVVVLVLAAAVGVDRVLPALIGTSFPARVAIVVGLLAPLGLVLGMPFPLGMRRVQEQCPELLPWAWAINGFLSVFSSIFCIVLAMAIGFSSVLFLAAGVYALGFLAMTAAATRIAAIDAG
jgi:spermidine synthase